MNAPATRFVLPDELSAAEPPEARGMARDDVRLLVARAGSGVSHARFRGLASFLDPGDLVVVNTSRTTAAAVDGRRRGGRPVVVHFSTELDEAAGLDEATGLDEAAGLDEIAGLDGASWVVELRHPDQTSGPMLDGSVDERVDLPAGVRLRLLAPYRHGGPAGPRLWRAHVAVEGGVWNYLARVGRPIRYGYLTGHWPLADYQTVFALRGPDGRGSAEMPSAGRPFSVELVTDLVSKGVAVAPIVLDTGVSSLESHEPPSPERYVVPETTARLVNTTRAAGGRVVAVGTTVTRALESAIGPTPTPTPASASGLAPASVPPSARASGSASASEVEVVGRAGWTDLVLGPDRPARVVSGLITGWHEPEASHLLLLEAVAGAELVQTAYDAAVAQRYLWHEFGDSCLLLP